MECLALRRLAGMHWGVSRHVWVNKAVAYWSISGIANPIVWQDQVSS